MPLPDFKPFKIMLARFPGNWSEHPNSSGYYMKILKQIFEDPRIDKSPGGVNSFVRVDTPITMVRNACVLTALNLKVDYLLMIDNDMVPDLPAQPGQPEALPFWKVAWDFMMARRQAEIEALGVDERIDDYDGDPDRLNGPNFKVQPFAPATIAAPYCGPGPNECVFVFRWINTITNSMNPNFGLQMFPREEASFRTGIEEVAALATGLILYDMRLFKFMPLPWYDYEWTDEFQVQKNSTEDVFQTRNASIAGFPQYVAWQSWAGHAKQQIVGRPMPYTMDDMRSVFARSIKLGLKTPDRVERIGTDPVLEDVRKANHDGDLEVQIGPRIEDQDHVMDQMRQAYLAAGKEAVCRIPDAEPVPFHRQGVETPRERAERTKKDWEALNPRTEVDLSKVFPTSSESKIKFGDRADVKVVRADGSDGTQYGRESEDDPFKELKELGDLA